MEKKQSGARGEERRGASWACPGQLREALQVFTSSKVLLCCREKQVRKNPERRYIPNERVRACVRACVRASVNKAVPSRLPSCLCHLFYPSKINRLGYLKPCRLSCLLSKSRALDQREDEL